MTLVIPRRTLRLGVRLDVHRIPPHACWLSVVVIANMRVIASEKLRVERQKTESANLCENHTWLPLRLKVGSWGSRPINNPLDNRSETVVGPAAGFGVLPITRFSSVSIK